MSAPSATMPARVALSRADLHESLASPLLDAMNFLNEIVMRFPHAISFAPGRPREDGFEPAEITEHLARYCAHLRDDLHLGDDAIRTHLFQYGRTSGHIRELIARTVWNDERIDVPPESIVVTVGCQEGMLLVVRALCRTSADCILAASPCYVGITGAARVVGADVVPVPEGPQGLDPDVLAASIARLREAGRRPRAVYLVPDFANPSGARMPTRQREALLRAAAAEDILVIEDNPYGFFVLDGEPLPTLKSLDTRSRVIYLGSFAKTCFPGARVGYVLADQRVVESGRPDALLADELAKIKSMTTVNTSTLSQAVIGGMLLRHGCRLRPANEERIALYQTNLRTLLRALDRALPLDVRKPLGVSWNVPDGGFFLIVRVPFVADLAALEHSAREHGVLWTPLDVFYPGGGGERQLRLSCSAVTPDEIERGIVRLRDFIVSSAQDSAAGLARDGGHSPAAVPSGPEAATGPPTAEALS
jgi:(S)-3,5-dihydroxyphenylglycine transaminase